jgi:hypothetical protein
LETRRLHTLTREEAVDRLPMDAEYTADSHGVEPPVMDQATDGLGMHPELGGHLTDADQTCLISVDRRHAPLSVAGSAC